MLPDLDPDRLHVRIVQGGRSSLWPWWHLHGACNPGWTIYANDRDGARITVRGRTFELRAASVMVIPPDTTFDSTPGPDVHQVYYHVDVLGFPAGIAAEMVPGPVDLGPDAVLSAQAGRLHQRLPDMRDPRPRAEPTGHDAHFAALAFVHQAFARLLDILPRSRRIAWSRRLRQHGPLGLVLRHIEDHLGEALYVPALAASCAMSPQWFSERFRAATGLTPAQYVLERRTAAAAQRLAFTDDPIEDVAERFGFTDRAHFARAFTKRRGLPPARYRQRERGRLARD